MRATDASGTDLPHHRTQNINRQKATHRHLFTILTITYASAIFIYSSTPGTAIGVGDKTMHVAAYFVLAVLVSMALRRFSFDMNRLLLAFVISTTYGVLDEIHQFYVPLRTFSYYDMLANTVGAITGIVLILALERYWELFLKKSDERIGIER